MKFSIIIPTKNRHDFIQKAIDSILNQDFTDYEIIVVDSSDVPFISNNTKIRVFHDKNLDITEAMNKGMKEANGDIIGWCNDDDRMAPNTLKFISENMGDSKWCYGKISFVDKDGNISGAMGEPFNYERLKTVNYIPQPSVFWKKEVLETVGMMDTKYPWCSDYEFWLRLGGYYEPKFFDRCMAYYTLHNEQSTNRHGQEQEEQAREVRFKYSNK